MSLLSRLLDLVCDNACAACSEPCAQDDAFCPACEPGLIALDVPWVATPYGRVFAAFEYGGPVASAIHGVKYGGCALACTSLGRLLAKSFAREAFDGSAHEALILPVPLTQKKLRERGHNVPALIAKQFGKALGLRVNYKALVKVRETAVQAAQDKQSRASNVAGAFSAQLEHDTRAHVIVLDDVTTTGATLHDCMRAAKTAGATRVTGVALARKPREHP
jgi:ComF family protein